MKPFFTFCLFCFCVNLGFAQNGNWSIRPYHDRLFVENIGQWEHISSLDIGQDAAPVIAGVEDEGTEIMFTMSGFNYRHRQQRAVPVYHLPEAAMDEDEPDNEGEDHTRMIWDTLAISAHWVNATGITYQLQELQSPLFHYAVDAGQLVGAKSYSKLSYAELYPGVDVDFTFHATEGIKYALTVAPGGAIDRVALAFSGMEQAFLDADGNLHLTLGDAELIDHAPTAYLVESGTTVPIHFVLTGSTLRFELAAYDHSQTLIIDPWLINPGFTTQGKVFDVGWDCSGNVYAFGGSGPWKVKKFNSAGVLQWTYNTSHTAWYGDLISDDLGNTYIIEGCCNGNRQKLNPAGVVQWTVSNGVYEFWRLAFSCDFSKLTLANAYSGGGIAPTQSLNAVNLTTGALSGGTTISASEPRSLTGSLSGNFYAITSVGNEVIARTSTYAPIYTTASSYAMLYNGPLYSNGTNTTQGQNGIAIYSTFIYTSNGATLIKRDIATGALLTSAAIPGGVAEQNSGVTVDNCGNVFAGSSNGNVYQYDVNLNPVSSFAAGAAVYDVSVNGTGQVLSAGNGFLASQVSPCVAVCPTCVILPAGLTTWDAMAQETSVALHWAVAQGDAYETYTVDRSPDGSHFVSLQTVNAGALNYDWLDGSPLIGDSWYRLSMRDRAGLLSYGPARHVYRGEGEAQALMVYPNPAGDLLHVQFPAGKQAIGKLEIYDAQGKLLYTQALDATAWLTALTLDVKDLPTGIYTLRVTGNGLGMTRFVKQ